MGSIIKKMERVLYDKKPYRLTALKQLQEEELGDPFKILIGTILSSRTRDETTTKVVKILFKRFKNAKELAEGNLEEIKQIIHSIGFYNVKAKRIIEVSQLIVKRFDGKVPNSIEKLLELPGVGRKTANCVLVYGFNKPTIPVDTHVHRISNRIGLVNTKTPEKTEIELNNIINKKYWLRLNNIFVMYGQNICLPMAPKCELCELKKMCKFYHANAKT
ncbi:MAG: endonuclease III [Nitrosopumilales archaeon]|nr:MAG: endonuclease III [Nitrosopumilales archaeon]